MQESLIGFSYVLELSWSSILFSKARFPLPLLTYWSSTFFSEGMGRQGSLIACGGYNTPTFSLFSSAIDSIKKESPLYRVIRAPEMKGIALGQENTLYLGDNMITC